MPESSKEQLDASLAEYLSQQSDDKKNGYTIAGLYLKFHEFARTLKVHTHDIEGLKAREVVRDERVEEAHDRLDAHRQAIVVVKRRLRHSGGESVPSEFDEEMDTGSFDIAAIKREVDEQRSKRLMSERARAEDTQWWKRTIIMWLAGGLGFVAVTAITILLTMAISGHK